MKDFVQELREAHAAWVSQGDDTRCDCAAGSSHQTEGKTP